MNGAGTEVFRAKHKTPHGSLSPSAEVTSREQPATAFGNEQASAGNAALAGAAAGAFRERTEPPLVLQKAYGNAAVGHAATHSQSLIASAAKTAPVRSQDGEESEELAPADKTTALAPKKEMPATPETPPAEAAARAQPGLEAENESREQDKESALAGGGEDKGTPARAKAEAQPEARDGAPAMPGSPAAPAAADVHVGGSSPGDVLASLATVPPSQFARGISQAEGASKTALANQVQATRDGIPELKTPTGMPAAGDPGAIRAKAASAAAAAAAAGGSSVARTPLKPGAGKQEVKTPVVQQQRPPEPTRLAGPEEPTGDPQADAQMAHDAQGALETVAVDDRGIPRNAGTAQPIKLDEEADPAQIDQESRKQARNVERAGQAERQETSRDFGEGDIAPQRDDSMIVTKVGIQGYPLGKLKAGPAGPSDVELAAGFDASLGPQLNRRVLDKNAEYDAEEQRFEADKQAAHENTRAEIAALEGDTAKKQTGRTLEAQKEVAAQREQWRKEIGEHQAKYEKSAEGAVTETRGKVAHEKQEGERKIAGHYAEADRKIASEHEDAKTKEEEARKKAKKKSSGFFGWVRRKAAALIDWLKDAVNFIYDNVRKAVKAAINFVKEAVLKVIDLVRDAVVGLINGLAAGLKLLVNIALIAFPETRRRMNAKIDAGVQTATKFVNDAADILKKGVAAALDFLASAIDSLLGLIQSIYNGILTVVGMIICGEFQELMRRIGNLVEAAKTAPEQFETAALEELLGGNLDEPLSPAEMLQAGITPPVAEGIEGDAPAPTEASQLPGPPWTDDNVGVDAVDNNMELSPELAEDLVEKTGGEGELEVGASEDKSRTMAAVMAEVTPDSATAEKPGVEAEPKYPDDGLTPGKRAEIKWNAMKEGIAKWWSDNWPMVLAASAAALLGFIALNVVTGGAITAALPVIMGIIGPLFVGLTVLKLAEHVKGYVEKGWNGEIRPAGKSLAKGLAAGAIELISYLTFKAGGLALKGAKALAKGGLRLAKAGMGLAKTGFKLAAQGVKFVIEKGKVLFRGIAKGAGKALTRVEELGKRLLERLRFRKFRITLSGRWFTLEGFINPWILLATGEIKKIPHPKDASGKVTRLRKGERLPDPDTGIEGIIISSKQAQRLKYRPTAAKVAAFQEKILEGNSTLLASRLKTPSGEQAHHLIASSEAGGHKAAEMAAKNGWDVNHAKNGLNIPDNPGKLLTSETPPRWIWHRGGHAGDYYAAVAKELDTVWNAFVAKGRPKGFDWIGEMNKASERVKAGILSGKVRLYTD